MIAKANGKPTTVCAENHCNPEGAEICTACGLPIVDFEEELQLLLQALGEDERHLRFNRERIFLGIGDQGCKLIHDFHQSWGRNLTNSSFLIIDSSGDAQQHYAATPKPASGDQSDMPSLSLHVLPATVSGQVGYFGLGERLASGDPDLEDRLRRSGIRASTRKQTVFLLSALGGGTGSGVSPYVLQRARALNQHCRNLAIAVMPGADEPDSAHFNAYCALSRFINTQKTELADMVLLIDHDRLLRVRGVGSMGEEIARDALLSHMLAMLVGASNGGPSSHADPSYLAKMSRSMGVRAFVPCMALGRSMDIFGSLANMLESALSCPLAELDKDSIVLSHLLVRVPQRLASSLQEEAIRAELNRWHRANFPRLKGSVLQLSHVGGRTDRIDLCLLLGGTSLATMARGAKEGFDRFKKVVGKKAWEQEFGVSSKIVPEVEKAIRDYDAKLADVAA
jgi:hypothetical protein